MKFVRNGTLADLLLHGPIVHVTVGPHPAARAALEESGIVPMKIRLPLLVDTGAPATVIDRALADQIGLVPEGFRVMEGAGGILVDCPIYPAQLEIEMLDEQRRPMMVPLTTSITGMPSRLPAETKHVGLLGRSALVELLFSYHGAEGSYYIAAAKPRR